MTQFEGPDSGRRREDDAAPAEPASAAGGQQSRTPPQASTGTGPSRWRLPLLAAAAIIVIGVIAVEVAVLIPHRGDGGAAAGGPGSAASGQQDASRGSDSTGGGSADGNTVKAAPQPGTPTDPFDCGRATTSDQVRIDESVRVGVNGDTFCAESGGGDTGLALQHAEVPISAKGPLLALTRLDDMPWASMAVGLADASVTRIVAVRGNEDTAEPGDIIRDEPLERYAVGAAGRIAFPVPDTTFTVAVVLYAGDTETGRFPLPVSEAVGMPEEAEIYDIRTDLASTRPMAWYSWQPVDESTVRLFFLGGPAVCYGAVVTVQADADAVRIGLRTGWKPETDVCTDNLVSAYVEVPLGEPLAGRPVEALLP